MRTAPALLGFCLILTLARTSLGQTVTVHGWDFGVVPYRISAEVPTEQRDNIAWSISVWETLAPVRFVQRTTQSGYLEFVWSAPSPEDAKGCSSVLGQPSLGTVMSVNVQQCADREAAAEVVGRAIGLIGDASRTLPSLYTLQLQPTTNPAPTELPRHQFDRDEIALAIERLNALYGSRFGMNRANGLMLGRRVDFPSIAHWILDIYIGARSQGWNTLDAFAIVLAGVTQSLEWQHANPNRVPLIPTAFNPAVSVDDVEFVAVMERLDAFYQSPDGLRRADGLAANGGPDFHALGTWVFDVYLTERLRGISPTASWTIVENEIRSSDEWRRRH